MVSIIAENVEINQRWPGVVREPDHSSPSTCFPVNRSAFSTKKRLYYGARTSPPLSPFPSLSFYQSLFPVVLYLYLSRQMNHTSILTHRRVGGRWKIGQILRTVLQRYRILHPKSFAQLLWNSNELGSMVYRYSTFQKSQRRSLKSFFPATKRVSCDESTRRKGRREGGIKNEWTGL